MLGFVTDRFFNVFMSLLTQSIAIKYCVVGLWESILSLCVPNFACKFGLHYFFRSAWVCRISGSCSIRCRQVLGLGVLLPCTVLPVFLYAALFWKAKRITSSLCF